MPAFLAESRVTHVNLLYMYYVSAPDRACLPFLA